MFSANKVVKTFGGTSQYHWQTLITDPRWFSEHPESKSKRTQKAFTATSPNPNALPPLPAPKITRTRHRGLVRTHTKLTSSLSSLPGPAQAAVPAEQPQTDAAHPQRRVPGHLRPLAAGGHQPLPADVSGTTDLRRSRWLDAGAAGKDESHYFYTSSTASPRECSRSTAVLKRDALRSFSCTRSHQGNL